VNGCTCGPPAEVDTDTTDAWRLWQRGTPVAGWSYPPFMDVPLFPPPDDERF